MGERTSYEPGTFCWVDLGTTDHEGAKAFYAALLGWEYEDVPIGDGAVYSMARLGGRDVAAIGPLQGGDGVPPHWNSYVSVADADASAARAAELGATVLAEPFDVFDSGRMAIFQDPRGSVLSVWQPGRHHGAQLVNESGALTWNDDLTPDLPGSAAFYSALFGWEVEPIPGAEDQYWSIRSVGRPNGGMMPLPPGGHPAWNLYFGTEDVDATTTRAGELGGGTVMGPMDVPNGRFAVLRDPQGAVFSVLAGPMDP